MTSTPGYGGVPGTGALVSTAPERKVWWGKDERNLYAVNSYIDSTVTDSGSTPTSDIRAGHLFAKHTSSGNLYMWDPTTDDGRDLVHAVLLRDQSMLDYGTGTAVKKYGHFVVAGGLDVDELFVNGTAFTSSSYEHLARRQLVVGGRYLLSDNISNQAAALGLPIVERAKATDYTVTTSDMGVLFTNTGAAGAVNFTLPAIEAGLAFEFQVVADQDLTVTSAAGDDMVAFNDAAADSVAFSTAGQKIGGRLLVHANDAGTLWYVRNMSPGNTITVAT